MRLMKAVLAVSLASVTGFAGACTTTSQEVKKEEKVVEVKPEPPPKPKPKPATIEEADAFFADAKYEEAKQKYLNLLENNPDNAAAKLGLANVYIKLGAWDEATALADELITAQPENKQVLLLKGTILEEKGDVAGALSLFNGALKKDPFDVDFLNRTIVLYRLNGKYEEGEKACTTLLSRHPNNVTALRNLSLIYFDQGKYALSETIAIDSLKLNDKDAALYNSRGMIRVKRGRYPEAMAFFLKAVELDPKLTSARLNIGAIALRYRDYDSATKQYSAVLQQEPGHPDANVGYGLAMAGNQKGAEAIKQLEKALEFAPKSTEAAAEIAMVYKLQLSKLDEALKWAEKYQEMRGGSLSNDDPMKAELQNIKSEIAQQKASQAALEKMKQEEEAEKAKNPPKPPESKPEAKPEAKPEGAEVPPEG